MRGGDLGRKEGSQCFFSRKEGDKVMKGARVRKKVAPVNFFYARTRVLEIRLANFWRESVAAAC